MPVLDEELTGYKNIRKVNVRNYIIFYTVDEEKFKVFVVRIGHAFMDWEKYLKDKYQFAKLQIRELALARCDLVGVFFVIFQECLKQEDKI